MGFFDRLNRVWSGLDFWDQQENRSQRQSFAAEDEEERKRRAREARRSSSPGTVVQPNRPDPVASLKKVGLQSQFKDGDLNKPPTPEERAAQAARESAQEAEEYKNRSFLDRVKEDVVPSYVKTLTDTPKTLERSAKRVATGIVQGAGGTIDILTPGKGSNRLTKWATKSAEEQDQAAKDAGVESLYKGFNIPLEIGSYALPSKAISKLPAANKLIKAGSDIAEAGANRNKTARFIGEGIEELIRPENLIQEARLTSRYLGQDSARGEEITPGKVAENLSLALGGSFALPMIGRGVQRLVRSAGRGSEDAVEQGVKEISEEAPEVPAVPKEASAPDVPAVEVSEGIKSTNIPRVAQENANKPPAPLQPVTPAPAQNIPDPASLTPAQPDSQQVMADFRQSVDAPLQKATPDANQAPPVPEPTPADVAEQAARGDLRVSAEVDAQGNPIMQSDAEAARQLAEEGVAPPRGPSPVATAEEQMAREAEQAVREDVSRVRQAIAESLDDPALKDDLLNNFDGVRRVNIDESKNIAKQNLNNQSDADIINAYRTGASIETPEQYFEAIGAIRRIQRVDDPEARNAISNIMSALDSYKAKGGQTLRVVKTLYEDMPTPMKVDYLMKKLDKVGARATMQEADQKILISLIEASDESLDKVRQLGDEATEIIESGALNNRSIPENIQQRINELPAAIAAAKRDNEIRSGVAWKFYQKLIETAPEGKTPLGKRAGDVGRTLMLSSPSGRIFDIFSTTGTTLDDVATSGVSNLLGKGLNLVKAPGTVTSMLPSPNRLMKGVSAGFKDTADQFKGKDRVEDFMGEATRATRGDINTGGGGFRRAVRSLVQLPTNITRGIRDDALYRSGMQEAAQQGLKGDAQKGYAQLRASVPNKQQLHEATEAWKKANMLHENGVSRFLNGVANNLDKNLGGWGAPLVRNQLAPFTSWLGGNIHRTMTDKNVVYNAWKIFEGARKGEAQMVVDNISKLAVNTGEAFGAAALLSKTGILTTEDANGDDYGGLYINIGDRYMPVAILGTMSVPVIMGDAIQRGLDNIQEGENPTVALPNALAEGMYRIGKNAGIAGVFGGENNLQQTVSQLFSSYSGAEGIDKLNPLLEYAGNVARQYIPGFTGEINAILDQTNLNPTREAAETKVTYENPKTGRDKKDVFNTEVAKTLARLPFASQALPRREDTMAKDLLDRAVRGNRENDEMAQKRAEEEQKEETSKTLEERKSELEGKGYSANDEGVSDAFDEGEYDWLVNYNKYKMEEEQNEGKLTDNERKRYESDVKKFEIYRDGDYEPRLVTAYEKRDSSDGGIGVTAWREMLESGDKKLIEEAEKLEELDQKLLKEGIIDKEKYYYLDGDGRRSRRGSGGGGRKRRFVTDIAKQSFSGGGFKPLTKQAATFGPAQSSIPQIQRVPNYDTSKLRKISVKRGTM